MAGQEYVITTQTGFQVAATNRTNNVLFSLNNRRDITILGSIHEDADKLVSLTPKEFQQLKTDAPQLVIEPNIMYKRFRHPFLENFEEISLSAAAHRTRTIRIQVVNIETNKRVPNVTIYLVLDAARKIGLKGVTNKRGECRFTIRAITQRIDAIILFPPNGCWNRIVRNVTVRDTVKVGLRSLPSPEEEIYDWGHRFAVMQDGMASGGSGVKIAVVDTGIRSDHPDLAPAGGVNCVTGETEKHWDDDQNGHGTHCAGVIAALVNGAGIKGYVPQAQIFSYRVFANDADGATTFAIATAIHRAIDDGCDIISMSLGAAVPQTAIRIKTELAYERGVLCVAATGNESTSVSYPAAFPTVIGVGAFGKYGEYPDDSLHPGNEPEVPIEDDGQYYPANFSNFGSEVDFSAPGVAIRSTVPGGYSAWDGTSMACPQVAGMAALALASRPDILNASRDAARVEMLVQFLKSCAQPLGFGPQYEGVGCLKASRILQPPG